MEFNQRTIWMDDFWNGFWLYVRIFIKVWKKSSFFLSSIFTLRSLLLGRIWLVNYTRAPKRLMQEFSNGGRSEKNENGRKEDDSLIDQRTSMRTKRGRKKRGIFVLFSISIFSFIIIPVKEDWDSCSSYHSLNEMNGRLERGGEEEERSILQA